MSTSFHNDMFHLDDLITVANETLGDWIHIDQHEWKSLYAWQDAKLYNDFGDVVGEISANTIYIYEHSLNPKEDLFHELGHAIAREFNFIGHRENDYKGSWEDRQFKLIHQLIHGRHWSKLLEKIWLENKREGNISPPTIASEVWAEMFMIWYFYPDRPELEFIFPEMQLLHDTDQIESINRLFKIIHK